MAISASRAVSPTVPGAERFTVTDITLDSEYPTGGESVTPADLGLSTVTFAVAAVHDGTSATAAASAGYDKDKELLLVYNTTAQVADRADLTGLVVRVLAFGQE